MKTKASRRSSMFGVNTYLESKMIPVNERWALVKSFLNYDEEFSMKRYKDCCEVIQTKFGKFDNYINKHLKSKL